MRRFHFGIFGLVICLVVAGCGGGAPPDAGPRPETTSTSSTDDRVAVEGDELPVDADRTLRRVERLLGTNGSAPTVRVREVEPRPPRENVRSGKFNELMRANVTYPAVDGVAGGTRRSSVELVYTDAASPGEIERTLAHEFVHVLQPDRLNSKLADRIEPTYRRTTGAKFARTSVVEGVAVHVADQYAETYLPNTTTRTAELRDRWDGWSVGLRSYWAPYYYGQRYVQTRLASGATLGDVYANPPLTAEQVLHGFAPDEEPRRRLTVNATTPATEWDLTTEDVKGELFIRHVLEAELSAERAKGVAAGWGNDRVFTYYRGADAGHVWLLRWDDEANASEFAAGFETYLDRRSARKRTDNGLAFDVTRPTPDTVAVVAGAPTFLNDTAVVAPDSGGKILVRAAGNETVDR